MSMKRIDRQNGFSLVEVLIAMLVLAIGLLGLAALQTQGVRFNHDAFVRTAATSLANDIIDKMRLNSDNASQYVTANFPALPYDCKGPTATSYSVQDDLTCWLAGVTGMLPLGRADIAQQAAPNDAFYDIKVLWLDREPRDFGGTTRMPQTQAECEALTNREWAAADGACLVTQTWTIRP